MHEPAEVTQAFVNLQLQKKIPDCLFAHSLDEVTFHAKLDVRLAIIALFLTHVNQALPRFKQDPQDDIASVHMGLAPCARLGREELESH